MCHTSIKVSECYTVYCCRDGKLPLSSPRASHSPRPGPAAKSRIVSEDSIKCSQSSRIHYACCISVNLSFLDAGPVPSLLRVATVLANQSRRLLDVEVTYSGALQRPTLCVILCIPSRKLCCKHTVIWPGTHPTVSDEYGTLWGPSKAGICIGHLRVPQGDPSNLEIRYYVRRRFPSFPLPLGRLCSWHVT